VQFCDLDVLDEPYLLTTAEGVERQQEAAVDAIDYQTGVVDFDARHETSRIASQQIRYRFDTRADGWRWLQWLHKMRGRYGEFFLPTFTDDVTINAAFAADAVDISIDDIGYHDTLDGTTMNRYLLFQRRGQLAPLPRYIVSSA